MEPGNFSPNALTVFNYKLFESFKQIAENPNQPTTNILCLKDLYELIENNFAELHENNNLVNLLPILHYTIQLESKDATVTINMCEFFQMLLSKYEQSEDDQKIVLQIYYQLLKSLPDQSNQFISMTDELFQTFCNLLTSGGKLLAANILHCLKLQITKMNRIDLLQLLWQKASEMRNNENISFRRSQIMVQFIEDFLQYIDNFYKNEILINIIQAQLKSGLREERKIAIYLLKKIIPFTINCVKNISLWEVNHTEQLNNAWQLYMTVFENFEEQQPDIILPTLKTIKNIKLSKIWLDLLYSQLLTQNNSVVQRWTIEYMLDNFVSKDLSQELLKQLLQAANTTNLYNYEDYCLSAVKIEHFLDCDLLPFFNVCTDIDWKSVPLHFWLEQIWVTLPEDATVSMETMIKIATKVRLLQNEAVRGKCIKFENIFYHQIDKLDIKEYLQLIDSLYNVSEYYSFSNLTKKLENKSDNLTEFKLTQRLYEIVNLKEESEYLEEQNTLLDVFQKIPKEEHYWFRFMIVFDFKQSEKQLEFCRNKYDLDFSKSYKLDELISKVVEQLVWEESEESFVHEKAVDYCVLKYADIPKLEEWSDYSIEELLDKGGKNTLVHIAKLISTSSNAIQDSILDKIIKKVINYNVHMGFKIYKLLLQYISKHMVGSNKSDKYVEKIVKTAIDENYALKALFGSDVYYTNLNSDDFKFVRNIFERKATHGNERVEKRYELELGMDQSQNFLHHELVDYIIKLEKRNSYESNYFLGFLEEGMKLFGKPGSFENSHEHLIKTRFGSSILRFFRNTNIDFGSNCENFELFWNKIWNDTNQLNVSYFIERSFVYYAPNLSEILKKFNEIRTYSPSQQVSIIVISYMRCITKWNAENNSTKNKLIETLSPLMLAANFQTRLYAQLAIYKILTYSEQHGNELEIEPLKTIIQTALGDKLTDLLDDIRFNVDGDNIFNEDIILYVTNAPFDEVNTISKEIKEKYAKCRKHFAKQINTTPEKNNVEKTCGKEICSTLRDIMPVDNLIYYPDFKMKKFRESNVIVVATLIDKLPNLGSVARTCELLGMKNLVINSSKHIDEDDFKHLSMTAEKRLNISEIKSEKLMEYLLQKQSENYEIIGAERTAKSQSFVDFKFPKKCIILLGHEKDGIPANILSILNHAVEIPQFGMVRMLNAHVTGALFMWEYCKQHIVSS